jgi:hypothetical protein
VVSKNFTRFLVCQKISVFSGLFHSSGACARRKEMKIFLKSVCEGGINKMLYVSHVFFHSVKVKGAVFAHFLR